jgi:microsomal dipeptidase-like Zn-dependent dipeptidase
VFKRLREWMSAFQNEPGETQASTAFGATRRTLKEPAKKLVKSDRTPEQAHEHKVQALAKLDEAKALGLLDSWTIEHDVPLLYVGPAWNNADPKAKKAFLQHANTYFLDGQEGFIAFDIFDARTKKKIARWGNFEPYVD